MKYWFAKRDLRESPIAYSRNKEMEGISVGL